MHARKVTKVILLVFYFLYMVFFTIEAQGTSLKHTSRAPASFVAVDQAESLPIDRTSWTQKVFVPDNEGILNKIKRDLQHWQNVERHRNEWNIGSSGLYDTPVLEKKQQYLKKILLQYGDKRFSGELKEAKAGSTLHRIKTVEKAISPKVSAQITKNLSLKFKARVLQRKGKIVAENPYISYHINLHTSGEVNMHLGKEFKALGVQTSIDYDVSQKTYTTQVRKKVTRNISSVLSSSQSDKDVPFGQKSDMALRINYTSRFP